MANTTFNPSDKAAGITLTGSNLIATSSGTGGWVRAVDKQITGKFYWEVTATTFVNNSSEIGIAGPAVVLTTGGTATGTAALSRVGTLRVDGSNAVTGFGTIASGTVVCFAVDVGARLIWVRLGAAGNWNNNVANNPATAVGGASIASLGVGIPLLPYAFCNVNLDAVTANFGDTAFVGAVPSGYTSGFTAGASVPTNALASQALAEHWLTTDPQAQITQVMAEHWMSVASGSLQAIATQVVLEHWMSVAVVVPASGGPQVTMIQ